MRSYGRIVRADDGTVEAIVEAGDATPEQLELRECNSSIYVFRTDLLWPALDRLEPHNAQGELYLTDAVRDLVSSGERVVAHLAADPAETEGVNTRAELAAAGAALRDRINLAHMDAGVAIFDPSSTWIEPGVEIEADAVVHPFTVLRGSTRVATGAEIGPHVVAIDAEIGAGGAGRALLLPSPGDGPRAALEGRHVRGDQEVADRGGDQGAASLLHRRRGDRGGNEHRRRDRSRRTSRTAPVSQRERPRSETTSASP